MTSLRVQRVIMPTGIGICFPRRILGQLVSDEAALVVQAPVMSDDAHIRPASGSLTVRFGRSVSTGLSRER